ncbi:DUF4651 domain-containing protein [Streptococcus oriscaviae]|uniref:DUF4651 domain-containing protein n=1 Tax=Streptococcus oriscaviae TaxID=2781599 RepID=A0ABX7YIF2_9STRE|nr:DUF4651 domain-containing protein [Streptococcus oriscaviae]QUE53465.1 DUF4651 domain-containing protein [Streptococcus oriscaviae]
MNKKKTALLAGLMGAGVLAASARFYMKTQEERKKAQALQQVREFFADLGSIATVFIQEAESTKNFLKGGVVMEDGRVFLFENNRGVIAYEEEVR